MGQGPCCGGRWSEEKFGADTPFVLLCRMGVKPGMTSQLLAASKKCDDAVRAAEPGMLHHTLDQDPDDPLQFVWTKLYANDDAFVTGASNPALGEFLAKHGEIGTTCIFEVYGTVGPQCLEVMRRLAYPLKLYTSKLGYSRDGSPEKLKVHTASPFGADAPFIVISRYEVLADNVDDFFDAAKTRDDAVHANEPGMLHHTFDQDADEPLRLVCTQLCENDEAFINHMRSPTLGDFIKKYGGADAKCTIECYGTLGSKCLEELQGLPASKKVYSTKLGFSRK